MYRTNDIALFSPLHIKRGLETIENPGPSFYNERQSKYGNVKLIKVNEDKAF